VFATDAVVNESAKSAGAFFLTADSVKAERSTGANIHNKLTVSAHALWRYYSVVDSIITRNSRQRLQTSAKHIDLIQLVGRK